ncbi:MAG: SET domain-containing protein-lysine N-methyltransferase, partial [Simkania negevensis]|nr:SET domain-containing protein-lysine N-methyltransferase [Simkania negevensis]
YISPQLGYGVFAVKDISALTYIGEYTGVVEKRSRRLNRFNNYIFGYVVGPKPTPFVINAEKRGNFTRFINHSDEPNLTSRWLIIEGITRVILFSNRLIQKGEQLTYDYGPIYWKKRSQPELI